MAYRNKKLYIVANNGKLYRFFLQIKNKKIQKLHLEDIFILRNKKDKALKKSRRDAEGLTFFEDKLLISFERKHRIALFSTAGKEIKKDIRIHKSLYKKSSYVSKNRGLEAVAFRDVYGVLTLPELEVGSKSKHVLYAQEKTWMFQAEGRVSAIEFVDEASLLVLLRKRSKRNKVLESFLHLVYLNEAKNHTYRAKFLYKLDGNYEGLTYLYDNLYLMVNVVEGEEKAELLIFELFYF